MAAFVIAGGCSKCYKVTDTSTNAVYYTHHVDRECDGTVKFRNSRTVNAWSFGEKVCLQSAQIERTQRCYCRSQDITEPPCPGKCPEKFASDEKLP
jgi:hypothetical protein